ncbi:MAG: DUF2236 domain-containing protein [Actinobacteria bacterium]|nr:DUF2236 domain-containing protein [Actinomycetota bacterium]
MGTATDLQSGAAAPSASGLPLSRSSLAWRVNAEPTAFLGAGRALLLQVAHPGVGSGVEQHSSYASDPWGRLFNTADIMMKLSFGTPEQARRQERVLRAKHRRVSGVTDDGTPYHALDPELLLWVWATLVDTALLMYELVRSPLRPDEVVRYYEESKATAHACGVPVGATPPSWGDFVDYVDAVVANDLRISDAARAVAVATAAFPIPVPEPLAWLAGAPTRVITTATLPPSLRERYGFSYDAATRLRFRATIAALRVASTAQPAALRHLPAEIMLRRSRPVSFPALQVSGGRITTARIRAAGFEPGRSGTPSPRRPISGAPATHQSPTTHQTSATHQKGNAST